jgi:hypothetical protein
MFEAQPDTAITLDEAPPLQPVGIDLFDLEPGQCRWPVSENPTLFCGAPISRTPVHKCSWCREHNRLGYVRSGGWRSTIAL